MRQKLPFEIYRTAVDIQGLFATGAGRAPSAVGQPEQVYKKAFELILLRIFLKVHLKSSIFQLDSFLIQEEEENEEAEEVQVEDSEEGGVRFLIKFTEHVQQCTLCT